MGGAHIDNSSTVCADESTVLQRLQVRTLHWTLVLLIVETYTHTQRDAQRPYIWG